MAPLEDISILSIKQLLSLAVFFPIIYLTWRAIYNIFSHPLRALPGPLLWRASSLPIAYYGMIGEVPNVLHYYHRKYGKEIRVAPDEISYTDSRAWKDIYNAKPEFPKDTRKTVYAPNGAHGIITAPRDEHSRFRRLLSHAFSDKGLRSQEPHIKHYVDLLIKRLSEEALKDETTNMADWYTSAVFDVIGELAWGESFNGLEERRVHEWIPAILGNIKYLQQFAIFRLYGLSKLAPYLTSPELLEGRKKNFKLAADLASKRASYGKEPRGDFWDRVLIKSEGDNATGEGMSEAEMTNNAAVLVLAGAETSATTLSGTTYLLLKHPAVLERLTKEIRSAFKSDDEIDVYSVNNLTYMLAVLDESMRIYPPVPNQLQRSPPRGGGVVCGQWLPESACIHMCQVAINRAAHNFAHPDDFIPERWLPDAPAEFANDDRQAFQPFVLGPRNCIGRNLAYAEMRYTLARVLYHFDLDLNDEKTGHWFDQKSHGVWFKGPLYVKLRKARHE